MRLIILFLHTIIFFMVSTTAFCVKNELFDLEKRVAEYFRLTQWRSDRGRLKTGLKVLKTRSSDPHSQLCKNQMAVIKKEWENVYRIITENITWQLLRTFMFEEKVVALDQKWKAGNIAQKKWECEKRLLLAMFQRAMDATPRYNQVKNKNACRKATQEACEVFAKYLK